MTGHLAALAVRFLPPEEPALPLGVRDGTCFYTRHADRAGDCPGLPLMHSPT